MGKRRLKEIEMEKKKKKYQSKGKINRQLKNNEKSCAFNDCARTRIDHRSIVATSGSQKANIVNEQAIIRMSKQTKLAGDCATQKNKRMEERTSERHGFQTILSNIVMMLMISGDH